MKNSANSDENKTGSSWRGRRAAPWCVTFLSLSALALITGRFPAAAVCGALGVWNAGHLFRLRREKEVSGDDGNSDG